MLAVSTAAQPASSTAQVNEDARMDAMEEFNEGVESLKDARESFAEADRIAEEANVELPDEARTVIVLSERISGEELGAPEDAGDQRKQAQEDSVEAASDRPDHAGESNERRQGPPSEFPGQGERNGPPAFVADKVPSFVHDKVPGFVFS